MSVVVNVVAAEVRLDSPPVPESCRWAPDLPIGALQPLISQLAAAVLESLKNSGRKQTPPPPA